MPDGVVSGLKGFLAGARAAGNAAGEQRRSREPLAHQGHRRQQQSACETAGMADVFSGGLRAMFRQGARERRQQFRRAVSCAVNLLVRMGVGEPKVRRSIHDPDPGPLAFSHLKRLRDKTGACAMRSAGKNRATLRKHLAKLGEGPEAKLRPDAREVGKHGFHRLAGIAFRNRAGDAETRMTGKDAQQFARHVAGSPQNCGRNAHSRPSDTLRATNSPSSALCVSAL